MGRDALRAYEARATLEDHAEARATLEDHAYGASCLPKQPKTTVLQSRKQLIGASFQFKNVTLPTFMKLCHILIMIINY